MLFNLLLKFTAVTIAIGISYAMANPLSDCRDTALLHRQEITSEAGAISGLVLDAEGLPVSDAEVQARDRESGSIGKVPTAYTNREGAFLIKNLPPGTYTITVAKEEDDYPPTLFPFYSAGFVENPKVALSEGQTISDVVIHLGQKAAKITGHIIDATNNKPVPNVQITLRRVDNPEYDLSTAPDLEGRFEILVPVVPVTVEISGTGYETKKLGVLSLARGESRRLNVSLRRAR